MTGFTRDTCESPTCAAPIIWAVTKNAKRMPVDYEPSRDGNVALEDRGTDTPFAKVLTVTQQFGRTGLRTSHFATCPDAKKFRKRSPS